MDILYRTYYTSMGSKMQYQLIYNLFGGAVKIVGCCSPLIRAQLEALDNLQYLCYLKKNPYLHNEGIKAILNIYQTAALYWVMNKELSHSWNV